MNSVSDSPQAAPESIGSLLDLVGTEVRQFATFDLRRSGKVTH